MELDEDWTENPPFRVTDGLTLRDNDAEIAVSEMVTLPLFESPRSHIATRHIRVLSATLLGSFTSTLRPIAISLSTSQSSASSASTSTASDCMQSIIASLTYHESTALTASDRRKSLLHAIGAGHTILAFVRADQKTPRPRTGQVAESLELLADILSDLGVLDCMADLHQLAENVRQLR